MLQLKNITKTYAEKSDGEVAALKGISLAFRPSEFVSILGPSGCGKTTLLNIIGGLDRYSDGDLLINGVSTKTYRDKDWDTYRNHSIGFVFQSYNLIPHLTILENVELSMTLGGVPKADRRKRAKEALIRVGLKEKLNKKPNQLSGGQMQRVSIARAIVNNPAIILADEPTGALDSETSITVMELLKEISETKLVIMVTHNPDLAEKYSDRIIRMLDGEVTEDTSPLSDDELAGEEALLQAKAKAKSERETDAENGVVKYKKKHSSMSFRTALTLSAKICSPKKGVPQSRVSPQASALSALPSFFPSARVCRAISTRQCLAARRLTIYQSAPTFLKFPILAVRAERAATPKDWKNIPKTPRESTPTKSKSWNKRNKSSTKNL